MSSSDISKVKVVDGRILELQPRYSVKKGGSQYSFQTYNSVTTSVNQLTYNCVVPSELLYITRDWQMNQTFSVTCLVSPSAPWVLNQPVVIPGVDFALEALPLNNLIQVSKVTINDATVTLNAAQCSRELMRFVDHAKCRKLQTAPCALPQYASQADAAGTINDAYGAFDSAAYDGFVGNGAHVLTITSSAAGVTSPGGLLVPYISGAPLVGNTTPVSISIVFQTSEPLVISPLVFDLDKSDETGFFGASQIYVDLTLNPDPSRLFRCSGRGVVALSTFAYAGTGITSASIQLKTISVPSDLPVPAKNCVPYMDVQVYSTPISNLSAVGGQTLQSNTVNVNGIPDLMMIYVRPDVLSTGVAAGSARALSRNPETYVPFANTTGGTSQFQLSFDNVQNQFASYDAQELFQISVKNGLKNYSWPMWRGSAHSAAAAGASASYVQGSQIRTSGPILVLQPGIDFPLSSPTLAPGVNGSYTTQYQFTLPQFTWPDDPTAAVGQVNGTAYLVTLTSGYFVSIRGASRILRGILSEADVAAAPMEDEKASLQRMVGGISFGSLSGLLSKAKSLYDASKPLGSAVKGMLPEGKVASAMGALGYGEVPMQGAAMGGRAMGGAVQRPMLGRRGRGQRRLEQRLE